MVCYEWCGLGKVRDESSGLRPCCEWVDEQKSTHLFESLWFWDEQVGGFPKVRSLRDRVLARV